MVRQGLRSLLEQYCPEAEIVAEASDGREALEALRENACDMLITDIQLPHIDGITLTRIAKKERPELVVLGVTASDEPAVAQEMVDAGACQVLTKESTGAELCRAVLQRGR